MIQTAELIIAALSLLVAIMAVWRVRIKVDRIHNEVKSPNGTTTGDSVYALTTRVDVIEAEVKEVKRDVKAARRSAREANTGVAAVAVQLGELQRRR